MKKLTKGYKPGSKADEAMEKRMGIKPGSKMDKMMESGKKMKMKGKKC